MPELPEVETVKRGLESSIVNETIKKVYLSDFSLRFPLPDNFIKLVSGKKASEKNMIEMELESPADDIVGFEHTPENAQQREKISKAIAIFKDKGGLFFPNVEAQCKITKSSAEFEADAGSGHAGFHVKWYLSCTNLSKIKVLSTSFFKIFPKAKEIEVEVASDADQREIEWDSDQNKIKLKLTK